VKIEEYYIVKNGGGFFVFVLNNILEVSLGQKKRILYIL
jgi:hypothetical protein